MYFLLQCGISISIHSLRVEGDTGTIIIATRRSISIHSLRVEGDVSEHSDSSSPKISIHSLRVEGDAVYAVATSTGERISIHSLRVEGDFPVTRACAIQIISIHSLRVEGDNFQSSFFFALIDFNPLPPCGGRRPRNFLTCIRKAFQSTPSVWRETT